MATYTTTFDATEDPLSESGAWTSGPGSWDGVRSDGGLAGTSNATQSAGRVDSFTPSVPMYAKGVLGLFESASQFGRVGVAVCFSTSNGDCYALVADDNTPAWRFHKCTDSGSAITQTLMGAEVTSPAPTVGDEMRLEVTDLGGGTIRLEGFINDVSIGTRDDSSSPFTSGRVGFVVTDASFNGFKLTSFIGGDAGGGDPEGPLLRGKLLRGGLLQGVLVR